MSPPRGRGFSRWKAISTCRASLQSTRFRSSTSSSVPRSRCPAACLPRLTKTARSRTSGSRHLGGGMTEMSCTLQVNPDNGDPSAQALINAKVAVTIKAQLEIESDDEPELPLDHQESVGDGEGVPLDGLLPESPDDEPM